MSNVSLRRSKKRPPAYAMSTAPIPWLERDHFCGGPILLGSSEKKGGAVLGSGTSFPTVRDWMKRCARVLM